MWFPRESGDYISIHAPARGATWTIRCVNCRRRNFNPRSHEGSDHIFALSVLPFSISIHAPTRGATHISRGNLTLFLISIHAPTRGATAVPETGANTIKISIHAPTRGATSQGSYYTSSRQFQSTLPRGERLIQER